MLVMRDEQEQALQAAAAEIRARMATLRSAFIGTSEAFAPARACIRLLAQANDRADADTAESQRR